MTSFAKLTVIIFGMAIIGFALVKTGVFKPGQKNTQAKASSTAPAPAKKNAISSLFGGNDELTVIVNTWGGYAPLAKLNGGTKEPNPESIISTKYGIDLTIKICDNFADSRNLFLAGEADILYCTADAFPNEMGTGSSMVNAGAKIWGQNDWSRGGDMILVTNEIKTAQDLKGKKIAVAEGTASNTFLIKFLETSGLSMSDVILVKVADGIEAAAQFKDRVVPAAVVWTPDGEDITESPEFKGKSRILASTEKAPFIIADCLISTEEKIKEKKELLVKFLTAWLEINGQINTGTVNKNDVARAFASVFFGSDNEKDIAFGLNGVNKVRLTTVGDNLNFFGLNATYTGVTGEQLYNKMALTYSRLNLTKNPLPWRSVSTTEIVEAVAQNLTGSEQEAEQAIKFTPVTAEIKEKPAISSKKVSINFETGKFFLTDEAKAILDREIIGSSKDFAGYRMRVEGNTDGVGNPQSNMTLSFKRAQAVVDYLISEGNFDPNRFIVQGNGSKEAIAAGIMTANEAFRRTDFQFVNE